MSFYHVTVSRYDRKTWLQSEEAAYPNGGQTRKGAAIFPDGKLRRVWVGIPDTYFSAPAHARIAGRYVAGWVSMDRNDLDSDAPEEAWLAFRVMERRDA